MQSPKYTHMIHMRCVTTEASLITLVGWADLQTSEVSGLFICART